MNFDKDLLKNISTQIRRDIIRMTHGAASGHPGGSLGCADLLTYLYFCKMKHQKEFNYNGQNEDVFLLSNGHISPVWYSTLARYGYFETNELSTFRKINTRLQGHPTTHDHLPGIRVASGSLGQGLSVASGIALAKRNNKESNLVYCLMGDGELQEGQIWEAALFAAHNKLNNLIALVDWNGKQIDGNNDDVISLGNLQQKWESFGWKVQIVDGHDFDAMHLSLGKLEFENNPSPPQIFLIKTTMGKGVDFMEDDHNWHGVAPNQDQCEKALAQLSSSLVDY